MLDVGDLRGLRVCRPGLFCFLLQRSGCGLRRLGCFFIRLECLFSRRDPLLEVLQIFFARLLPCFRPGQLLCRIVGLKRRFLQRLRFGIQSGLGFVGRFALGGGIRGGLLGNRVELDDFLARFPGRLIRSGRGRHLIARFCQGLVARLLLRLGFGQFLRGGRGLSLRLLFALPGFGQSGPGIIGRFPLGNEFIGSERFLRVRLGGIPGNLLGLRVSGLGGLLGGQRSRCVSGHLIFDIHQSFVGRFLLCPRFGQLLCGSRDLSLRLLFALLRLSQSNPGIRRRFAPGGRVGGGPVLLPGRFLRVLGGLPGSLESGSGSGYLILGAR